MTIVANAPPMIGPDHCLLAAYVPEAYGRAIDEYEEADWEARSAYKLYLVVRDCDVPPEYLVDIQKWYAIWDAAATFRLLVLEEAIPVGPGWYPHGGSVWGWAKRSKCGLSLVREPGSCPVDDEEARRRWYAGVARKAEQDRRIAEFSSKGE